MYEYCLKSMLTNMAMVKNFKVIHKKHNVQSVCTEMNH